MKTNTCCFIGHRAIFEDERFELELFDIIENLIVEKNVDTFYFGSKSQFNSLCLKIVTKIKEKYPHIKRIYVRAEYQYISEKYKEYLLQNYEDTYYPEKVSGSGRLAYIIRNYEMINNSHFCIMYYNCKTNPKNSGTKFAYLYARKLNKQIINVSDC